MNRVDNGGSHELLIEGVHSGRAGSETGPDGALIVAFKPNLGRAGKALIGATVRLDGAIYRVTDFALSTVSAGFVRLTLQEVA